MLLCLCSSSIKSVLGLLMAWAGTRNRLTANNEEDEEVDFDPDDFAYVTVRCGCHKRAIFVCASALLCEKKAQPCEALAVFGQQQCSFSLLTIGP